MSLGVFVDDNGLEEHLHIFTRREITRAQRKALSKLGLLGRTRARGAAPKGSGSHGRHGYTYIYSKTGSKRGFLYARVGIRGAGYWMVFMARGVTSRHTRRGWNRGSVQAVPFMREAADMVDPIAPRFIEEAVRDALRRSSLT